MTSTFTFTMLRCGWFLIVVINVANAERTRQIRPDSEPILDKQHNHHYHKCQTRRCHWRHNYICSNTKCPDTQLPRDADPRQFHPLRETNPPIYLFIRVASLLQCRSFSLQSESSFLTVNLNRLLWMINIINNKNRSLIKRTENNTAFSHSIFCAPDENCFLQLIKIESSKRKQLFFSPAKIFCLRINYKDDFLNWQIF